MIEETLFGRIGALSARRPWAVVALWIALIVAMGRFAGGLPGRLGAGGFEIPGSQSLAVQRALEERFSQSANGNALVVIHHPTLRVTEPAYRAAVEAVTTAVKGVEGVTEVTSVYGSGNPMLASADAHTTYLVISLRGTQGEQITAGGAVSDAVDDAVRSASAFTAARGFEVHTGGAAAFFAHFNDVAKEDLEAAEKVSFPITLVVLAVAFGSGVAAGLPILLALASLIVTLGALFFLAGVVDMSIYVTNTARVIGIGVGIDYALFVVTRYRDELRHGFAPKRAVARAVATAGQAVALSGMTVIVALAGMFLVEVQAFASMAIGSMAVVAVAVVAALTLLPAALALLGHRIDWLRVPSLPHRAPHLRPDGTPEESGFWHGWAVAVMRRPWLALVGSLVVLLVLAAPFAQLRLGQPSPEMLPAEAGPRLATEQLAEAFGPGVTGPIEIVVEAPGGAAAPANQEKVGRLVRALQGDADVALAVASGAGSDVVRVTAIGKQLPNSAAAERLVERIRGEHLAAAGLTGAANVGGATAANLDLARRLSERLPLVVATVLALSFLLLVMAFRSLLLPLKAMLMNLLSVGAAYGLIVATFQFGWGERLLGFTSPGNVTSFIPLFLFSILFGLSMDYEVFLMSRMKEEYERTNSNELAVAHGLEATARTITSAALIMVTVFAAFAAGRLVPFKAMGFGLAAAVFLDATLVRLVLVPAAMKLMGHWNWWMPRALDSVLPRIDLERASSPAEAPASV
jgi:RND superfamily putative drug exporter